ncbi:MAG: hypothetical protein NTW21_43140 [Verrucomicrobia bacterium]|nr:hypothetical protein [Verrucomicrobiota bacterium]
MIREFVWNANKCQLIFRRDQELWTKRATPADPLLDLKVHDKILQGLRHASSVRNNPR